MAGVSEQWPLVGRSEELAMLDEQVGERCGAMVVAGAVGVGKSGLLTGWLQRLAARGRPTVVVRATRSTATIPFGAFARWVPEHLGDTRDRLGVLQATAARLAELGQGLVVAVDDAQLLDEGSAALVLHLAEHTPSAAVVVAVRSGEPCPDAIVALWKERIALRLDLQPLSRPQLAELVELALHDPVAPATHQRLWQLSEGNPLYLREVVDTALAHGNLTRSGGTWQWRGRLAERTRLVELVADRLDTADPDQRRVLELVALGEPLPGDVVARLAPREVLSEIERRGWIVTEQVSPHDAGPVVRLAHPLYSEVLRAELPAFTAQRHRLALAEAAFDAGAQHRDPLRVATWALDGGGELPDPELLLRASFVALITDEYRLCLRLAVAAEEAGGGWRATLRRAEALSGLRRWDDAEDLLIALAERDDEPDAQAAAANAHAELLFWHRAEGISVAVARLAEAEARVPPQARASLLAHRAALSLVELKLDDAIRLSAAATCDTSPEALDERVAGLGCATFAATLQGRTQEVLSVIELAAPYAYELIHANPVAGGYLVYAYSYASVLAGRIDEGALFFKLLLDEDIVRMGGLARALPVLWRARAVMAQGRVATATQLCRDALDVIGDHNLHETGTWVATTLAAAAAQCGDIRLANQAMAWIDTHQRVHAQPDDTLATLARAWVNATRGELSAARDIALAAADRARDAGAWALEMMALLEATRLGAARTAAPRLAALTGKVEGSYTEAAAAFASAAARRNGTALDDAAARFAALGARLLAAEAAACAVEAHTAAGHRRERAASLATAQELAARCEGAATPLLAQLDHEPVAATLTAREREVTELAARGHSSREIADALVISVRTVDSHLNHAYTKLGISDRDKLASILGIESRA